MLKILKLHISDLISDQGQGQIGKTYVIFLKSSSPMIYWVYADFLCRQHCCSTRDRLQMIWPDFLKGSFVIICAPPCPSCDHVEWKKVPITRPPSGRRSLRLPLPTNKCK